MEPIDILLSKLQHFTKAGRNKWKAKCPAHDDGTPSLQVTRLYDGRVLIHCFAGCGATEVLDALGLRYGDLYPDSGEYKPVVKEMSHDEWMIWIAQNSTSKLSAKDKKKVKEAKLRAMLRENRT